MRRMALGIVVLVLALASCEMRGELKVNSDGSGTMGIMFGIDRTLLALMPGGQDPFADAEKGFKDDPVSWKMERFSTDKLVGFRASFPFSSVDDLKAKMALLKDDSKSGSAFGELDIRKTATGWEFSATPGSMPSSAGATPGGGGSTAPQTSQRSRPITLPDGRVIAPPSPVPMNPAPFDLSGLGSSLMDIQLWVTLPGALVSTNAAETKRAGRSTTFIWKPSMAAVQKGERLAMTASTRSVGGGVPVLPLTAGLLVLSVGSALAVVARRRPPTPAPVLEGIGFPDVDREPSDREPAGLSR